MKDLFTVVTEIALGLGGLFLIISLPILAGYCFVLAAICLGPAMLIRR